MNLMKTQDQNDYCIVKNAIKNKLIRCNLFEKNDVSSVVELSISHYDIWGFRSLYPEIGHVYMNRYLVRTDWEIIKKELIEEVVTIGVC